jgi:hypothetical protein
MNPPAMETLMLALSGVVLASGVLYWFWSHIQLMQKKVQLLENAVFDLRGELRGAPPAPVAETAAEPAPFEDVDWEPEAEAPAEAQEQTSTPLEALEKEIVPEQPASLEAMPLKELRRLAEQRGIPNTSDMRKKELLSVLRSQVAAPADIQDVVDLE